MHAARAELRRFLDRLQLRHDRGAGLQKCAPTLRISLQVDESRFLVKGLWDKNTGICAGAKPYRRDFPSTTRILAVHAEKGMLLPAILFLAWM